MNNECNMLQINNDLTDFISIKSPNASGNIIMLVDSQADISIIKISAIPNISIDRSEFISMKGITEEKQLSLGLILINIHIGNLLIEHKFHLIADTFPLPSHGIIGKDFLRKHKCNLDFSEMIFSIRPDNVQSVHVPLQCKITRGLSAIPPRCEAFKLFHINHNSFPCIVPAQQIGADVFISNSIAFESRAYIGVLNTDSNIKLIDTVGDDDAESQNVGIIQARDIAEL